MAEPRAAAYMLGAMIKGMGADQVAYYKGLYEKHGGDRTNLVYGYINKG